MLSSVTYIYIYSVFVYLFVYMYIYVFVYTTHTHIYYYVHLSNRAIYLSTYLFKSLAGVVFFFRFGVMFFSIGIRIHFHCDCFIKRLLTYVFIVLRLHCLYSLVK